MSKSRKYFGKERLPTPPPGHFHSDKGRNYQDKASDIEEGLKEHEQSQAQTEGTESESDENR